MKTVLSAIGSLSIGLGLAGLAAVAVIFTTKDVPEWFSRVCSKEPLPLMRMKESWFVGNVTGRVRSGPEEWRDELSDPPKTSIMNRQPAAGPSHRVHSAVTSARCRAFATAGRAAARLDPPLTPSSSRSTVQRLSLAIVDR